MDHQDRDPLLFGVGLVLGGVLLAFLIGLAAFNGLGSGFYGVPPNATWYQAPAAGAAAAPAASSSHGH